MKFEELENFFNEQGYGKIPSNLPEFTFFFRMERACINVVHVVNYREDLYISKDQYEHLKETIIAFFKERYVEGVHILSLLISTDTQKAKQLCGNDPFCWLIDPLENRLIVHEAQAADFYGIRGLLEDFLYAVKIGIYHAQDIETRQENAEAKGTVGMGRAGYSGRSYNGSDIIRQFKISYVTCLLVLCNILLFIICTFTGDLVYNIGAFSVRDLAAGEGWYRLLSSIFLHADIGHLVSNMLILYYVGSVVEKQMGHLPYLTVYLLSGFAGNILSAGYELYTSNYVSSIGASGAVFGVEGALIVLVILHHGKLEYMTLRRVVFAVVFSLYCGFTGSYVNNAAHVGGVMMGFVLAALIWFFNKGSIWKE